MKGSAPRRNVDPGDSATARGVSGRTLRSVPATTSPDRDDHPQEVPTQTIDDVDRGGPPLTILAW